MENRYLKTDLGIVDLKKGTETKPYYEVGDTFIFEPENDGSTKNYLLENRLKLANRGQIGKIIKFTEPYYSSEDSFKKMRYKTMLIEVDSERLIVHPVYYRLGWKFKKEEKMKSLKLPKQLRGVVSKRYKNKK